MIKNLFLSLRNLCLVALACMVTNNVRAYEVFRCGDNASSSDPWNCKFAYSEGSVILIGENATADVFFAHRVVIIVPENVTFSVTSSAYVECSNVTIYVCGTMDFSNVSPNKLTRMTFYVMQGGSLLGIGAENSVENSYNVFHTNVNLASLGTLRMVDAQSPTPENGFTGWPMYYQRVVSSPYGSDFGPIASFEDEACTRPISDLDTWMVNYCAPFRACYDAGYTAGKCILFPTPTQPGMRLKVTTKEGKQYEFPATDIKKVNYYHATE